MPCPVLQTRSRSPIPAAAATQITCDLKYVPYSYFSSADVRQVVGSIKDARGMSQLTIRGRWDQTVAFWPGEREEQKQVAWVVNEVSPAADRMYGFGPLTCELNEWSPYERGCATTDARYRMDKNVMETGDFDMANRIKHLLEEGQRARRKDMEARQAMWSPLWFSLRPDPMQPNRMVHQYKGGYWEAKDAGTLVGVSMVDVYDISAVVKKDPEAAQVAMKVLHVHDRATA